MRIAGAVVALTVLAALGGCGDDAASDSAAPSPESPSISTLSPLPIPDMGPPEGELVADLRQASRDSALGRFQVWIGNGLAQEIDPTRISYVDPRFRAPILGERLRPDPADSERGYPLALPSHPACGETGRGRVVVAYDGRQATIPVEDEADIVARYVASRCLQLDVEKVAHLSFEDEVAVDREGKGSIGALVLVARPTGRSGPPLTIASVGGTPVLTAQGLRPVWRPDFTVRGDGPIRRIELPVRPARCDGHAFLESGSATAFLVQLRLGDRSGELIVRMSDAGARNAIRFARDSCGLG